MDAHVTASMCTIRYSDERTSEEDGVTAQVIDVERSTPATVDAVWRLLGTSETWPAWTPIEAHRRLRQAGPDGTGEVRLFTTGRYRIREEVVERREPERLSYTLLGGLALRDYRADIDLRPAPDGGTRIHWHTEFRPKVPGSGRLYRRALERATVRFADGLARHAAAGPSAPDAQSADGA